MIGGYIKEFTFAQKKDTTMPALPPVQSFNDIRALLSTLPDVSDDARLQVAIHEKNLTKPQNSLGRLEEISAWVAASQFTYPPSIHSVHCNVYAGNHGVVAQGVSAYPATVTQQMVQNFIDGGAAVNQLCGTFNVDLQVHEMALDHPTADMTLAPAMSEEDCAEAFLYGMTTVKDHTDLLCLGEMGIGNTTAAAALALALYGGDAATWTGYGTGIDQEALERKTTCVAKAVAQNKILMSDPLEIMRCVGGRELAAMAGACVAARLKNTPVLIDGYVATAALAPLAVLQPNALDHCMVAHRSKEIGHALLCEKLGKLPLLDLDMGLGEGSGAVMAVGLCRAAVACHSGMATFDHAGVDKKVQ